MKRIFALSLASVLAGCSTTPDSLPTQSGVDLNKYAGTWYEQSRLPNRFQDDCVSDVQADYAVQPDGTLSVTNQCKTANNGTKVAHAEGRLNPAVEPRDPARLQVRFAPEWTSWIPWVWGDYWIIKLDDNYQYSLVGTPDRNCLWVLSRDKQADPAKVQQLLDHARSLGFPVENAIR